MEDEKGGDEKLLCVPVDSLFPYYRNIQGHGDLPEIVMQQIEHFFAHYKDLEPGKWVKIQGWGDAAEAREIVAQSIARAKGRSEEHTSELQSLMRISYAVFCLKTKTKRKTNITTERR